MFNLLVKNTLSVDFECDIDFDAADFVLVYACFGSVAAYCFAS